jgi:hypothetical protein
MATYIYDPLLDTLNGTVTLSTLNQEIKAALGISPSNITINSHLRIRFNSALDAGQQTTLTSTVAAHGGNTYPHTEIYKEDSLLNGGSESLKVDGATTPLEFTYGPSAGEVWKVESLSVFISDAGSTSPEKFGAILGGLTNGLQIIHRVGSTDHIISNCKNNMQLSLLFLNNSSFSLGSRNDDGWFNEGDYFIGSKLFKEHITLIGDRGDKIVAKVQDDLTGLNRLIIRASSRRSS